ncbi:MAG: hypothetical protein QW265_01695 [Candidatus Bathyarchaeia archaeon]
MLKFDELIQKSMKVNSEELMELIENVIMIITEERKSGKFGNGKVNGGLVLIPPRHEMLIIGDIHGDLESLKYILENSSFLNLVLAVLGLRCCTGFL